MIPLQFWGAQLQDFNRNVFWSLHLHFHGQLFIWSARHLGTQSSVGSQENQTLGGSEEASTQRKLLSSDRAALPRRVQLYRPLYQKPSSETAGPPWQQLRRWACSWRPLRRAPPAGLVCKVEGSARAICIGSVCSHFPHCFLFVCPVCFNLYSTLNATFEICRFLQACGNLQRGGCVANG